MKVATRKIKIGLLLLFLGFAAFAVSIPATQHTVTAAVKNGFVTSGGKTYYYKNGVKQKGWLTLNGKKYYFNTSSGVQVQGWITLNKNRYYFTKHSNPSKRTMAVGWRKDASGKRRYFLSTGAQVRGKFLKISGKLYYFASNGIMQTGWIKIGSNKYYANSTGAIYTNKLAHDSKRDIYRYFDKNGKMIRGWYTFAKGERYFQNGGSKDGVMARGKLKISGKYYYFRTDYGYKQTGWVTDANGNQYYCDASNNGAMVVSTTKTINGIEYVFDSAGIAKQKNSVEAKKSTGTKTIRNYLLGCMLPVGQALYVWGGGWNDSNRKGVSPKWKQWYDSQTSSYNYNNYRDLSTANRAKGLDCSGFVGWAAYQVMQQKSGATGGYTVVSGQIGSYYKSLGWGSIISQSDLSKDGYKLYPGDVGYNDGHTWIVVGQCKDKSIVVVHSTPQAGCQIAGTPTPDGSYSSQAVTLAKKYMSRYPGYTKYEYHPSSGNYIKNGKYLRWNRSTLEDPDGYMNKTADQILKDIFGY